MRPAAFAKHCPCLLGTQRIFPRVTSLPLGMVAYHSPEVGEDLTHRGCSDSGLCKADCLKATTPEPSHWMVGDYVFILVS